MTLEWLRRTDPVLDQHLRTYLFTEGSITEIEHEAEHEDGGDSEQPVTRHRKLEGGGSPVNHLFRELAPITADGLGGDRGRGRHDAAHVPRRPQARRLLRSARAGRSPRSTSGRVESVKSPHSDVGAALRKVQPLVELRTDFTVSRAELDAIERGSQSPDLDPVRDAAVRLAEAEDKAVFHGFAAAGIEGLSEASEHDAGHDPRGLRGLPARGGQGRCPLARQGRRRPVRHRARPALLHRRGRDDPGRLPGAQPHPHDPRRSRSSGRPQSTARSW